MDEKFSDASTNSGFCTWFLEKVSMLLDFVCAFLEMHFLKIVSVSIMAFCCSEVNALHLIVVIILVLSCTFGIKVLKISHGVIGIILSLLLLAEMVYQTQFIPQLICIPASSNKIYDLNSALLATITDPQWWGIIKLNDRQNLISVLEGSGLVLLLMTLKKAIIVRQQIARVQAGESPETPHVLYKDTTREDADTSLEGFLKYLLNYGFYKLGVEITLIFCAFDALYRLDAYSILYSLWVIILFMLGRKKLSEVWPVFTATLVISIPWQYIMALGFSKNIHYGYPWCKNVKLIYWLYLSSNDYPLNTYKILVDFCLLLLTTRQQAVFDIERKYGDQYLGGSNETIYMNYYRPDFVNPVPNHKEILRSWADVLKVLFLSSFFRITLGFLFWIGASAMDISSLGYLVASFIFLWIDYDLCLWHIKRILKWWNVLLAYCVLVVFVKSLIEFPACLFMDFLKENVKIISYLLPVSCHCVPEEHHIQENITYKYYWDVACFAFVLLQRRYFQSYYFLHEVDDVWGIYQLQAKGAKLMDELQETTLKEFQMRQRRTLMKIKENMNRIKAWQKRMQGLNYTEPEDHDTAIYMGDYYMFENLQEFSTKQDSSSSSSDEFDKERREQQNQLTMSEFIDSVFKKARDEPSRPDKTKDSQVPTDSKSKPTKSTEPPKKEKPPPPKPQQEPEKSPKDPNADGSSGKGKLKKAWKIFVAGLNSLMVSLIRFFYRYSKNYRYIVYVMKKEKKKLRMASKESAHALQETPSRKLEKPDKYKSSPPNVYRRRSPTYRSYEHNYFEDKSTGTLLVNLINAVTMFFMSKTELFCYFFIFLHTVLSPTLISLPLPLLVFLWGSLTPIRPTTTFWTVLIAYTEVTIVIKALFQNNLFPWNQVRDSVSDRPEYPPLVLGIHRDNRFVIADLILLIVLFLHRYKLKTLGLWSRTHEDECLPPQNLMIYNELASEEQYKGVKGNRSLMNQRKILMNEGMDSKESVSNVLQMATWRCTSKATGKVVYRGKKKKTKIKIKEVEGKILVTHEGRRLEPTYVLTNKAPKGPKTGDMVLRVYINGSYPRDLFCRLSWVQHFSFIKKFFTQIIVRDFRVSADFYTFIFLFAFINFMLIFFGYSFFIETTDISNGYFSLIDYQIPPIFLVMTISHFFVIIIDRVLYLTKNIVGKLILQFSLVILVHVWMFIIIPILRESPFTSLAVPQVYYTVSCFYFLSSAYQLRVGYPMRVQGHFLCQKYGYVNLYAYRGLKFIPFFNQLRTLLDFLCTHSSLSMMQWIEMESMFQVIYENKCSRYLDINYPAPRGKECPKCPKYFPGVTSISAMIFVIWFPFLIYLLFSAVAEPNIPQKAMLNLHLGSFGKIYETKVTFRSILRLTACELDDFKTLFKFNKKVSMFLNLFDYKDVAVLKFEFEPNEPWFITPQQFEMLKHHVENLNSSISFYMNWEMVRATRSQIDGSQTDGNARSFREVIVRKGSQTREELVQIFKNNTNVTSVHLNRIIPKFIQIKNDGEAKPVEGFLQSDGPNNAYRNSVLTFAQTESVMWWKVQELCDDEDEKTISKIPHQSKNEITIYTFNEKSMPKEFISISKKGIIGLYISVVLVTWGLTKRLMWKYPYILYNRLPNPDPVLKLCNDIYLARESFEFALEEDLFAKLLFLFRSPETMIKVTRLNPS